MLQIQLFLPWLGNPWPPISAVVPTAVAAAAGRVLLDRGLCPGRTGTVPAAHRAGLGERLSAPLRLGKLQGPSLTPRRPGDRGCAHLGAAAPLAGLWLLPLVLSVWQSQGPGRLGGIAACLFVQAISLRPEKAGRRGSQ